MYFVPEGQADSSQAGSAWVRLENRVPEGQPNSLAVPEIFVLEPEPGKRQRVEWV
jgi:hypothetical protein